MTIQLKLSLSITCAVAATIILALILTWVSVSTFIVASEEAHFASMAQNVESNFESSFHEFLNAKVRVVLKTKNEIYSLILNAWHDVGAIERILPPSKERDNVRANLLKEHLLDLDSTPRTSHLQLMLTTSTDLILGGFPALGLPPCARDFSHKYIGDIVAQLPEEGAFSLWPLPNLQNKQILLFMLPIPPGTIDSTSQISYSDRMLVAGMPLTSLFAEAEQLLQDRLTTVQNVFDRILYYKEGCIMLCDAQGKPTIKSGNPKPIAAQLPALCAAARKKGKVMEHVDTSHGKYLCHVAWIQSYDSFFVMSAGFDELSAPSKMLVSRLGVAGCIILLVAICCTVPMAIRTLKPLQVLRDCTSEMAEIDPTSQAGLTTMETMVSEHLNVQRRDELGDLARSFATMGSKLAKNIRASFAAMTEQKRLEGELSAARDIQMSILPILDESKAEPGFMVSAFLEPAQEVGGDLYDSFTVNKNLKALVLGDVSGKGVPAALFMTMSVTLIRYALRSGLAPAQAMSRVNDLLEEHNSGNMFVTLFLALYDPKTGHLQYANGGHCLPYIVSENGNLRQLENLSGPLVGAMPNLPYIDFEDQLATGDRIFIYTDGLTEAMNATKELYGEQRLAQCLKLHAQDHPKALQEAVFNDICAFRKTEPPSDDITMLTALRT